MPFEADQRAHLHVKLPDLLGAAEIRQVDNEGAASTLAPICTSNVSLGTLRSSGHNQFGRYWRYS
jgi:hypothetical protein